MITSILCILLPLTILSCDKQPEPIEYGKDNCHWCQMKIMDPKFGSEAITAKGRIYKFDSGECLIRYINKNDKKEHSHILVTDYKSPNTLIDATNASYLISEDLPSPMGADLSAYAEKPIAEKVRKEKGGEVFSWNEVKEKIGK